MKRIFTVITILISISLIGIIFIQLSWLHNMILLREEQVKEKVVQALNIVGNDLLKYKEDYSLMPRTENRSIFQDEMSVDLLRPALVGKRFSSAEINEKFQQAFKTLDLDRMQFEFLLATVSPRSKNIGRVERMSQRYAEEMDDSVSNFSRGYLLQAPPGSAGENLGEDETLVLLVVDWQKFAVKSLRMNIASSILFTIIIITAFYLTVRTMLRQKKLGEIKNDFINNMTHEFKTPIATISLAVDAMKNEKVLQDKEKMTYFSSIIKEENQRMNRQVETILKASQLERQEADLNLQPVHVHEVINDVIGNFQLQLHQKNGNAELNLAAANDLINADEVHFSNLVNNLVDNAVKYSKEGTPLQLKISSQSTAKNLIVRVEDNGIGMNKETVKRVFERFYRAHTGNLHNVKGFGLGLSYVKTMVEAHGGDIKVDSVLGRGSVFTLELPLKK